MDMRQAFMLFTLAHCLGFYYFSSFKQMRSWARLIPELILYCLAVVLVFLPVLDGNNFLYALTIVVFHILVSPLLWLVTRRSTTGKARSAVFFTVELVRITGFAVMAFFFSVRWGSFEPWREVRFFLVEAGLDYNQVLAALFTVVLVIRPANIIVKKVLAIPDEECEVRHFSGAATGIIERLFYMAMLLYGSYVAFAVCFFAKCTLFCFAVRKDGEYGLRLYMGSLVSALLCLPVALIARPFF